VLVSAVSLDESGTTARRLYRLGLAKITIGKQCGAPPRAHCDGWLRINAVV
jgi:hypothetical protein